MYEILRLCLWACQLHPMMFTSHHLILWSRLWAHLGFGSTECLHWCGFIFSSDIRRINSAHFRLVLTTHTLTLRSAAECNCVRWTWCLSLVCFLMLYLILTGCIKHIAFKSVLLCVWCLPGAVFGPCVALKYVHIPRSAHIVFSQNWPRAQLLYAALNRLFAFFLSLFHKRFVGVRTADTVFVCLWFWWKKHWMSAKVTFLVGSALEL